MANDILVMVDKVVVGWVVLSCLVAVVVVAVIAGGRCRESSLPRTRVGLRAWIRGESEQREKLSEAHRPAPADAYHVSGRRAQ